VTTDECAVLLVQTICRLSAMATENESWRLLAVALIQHNAELTREIEMIDERQYICRTRQQDVRDVFLDQRDLRREAA
jgi:hypothetical protein